MGGLHNNIDRQVCESPKKPLRALRLCESHWFYI